MPDEQQQVNSEMKPLSGRPRADGTRHWQQPDNPLRKRNVSLPDDDWAHCVAQPGGASAFLRRLIAEHKIAQETAENQDETTGKQGENQD